MSWNLEVACIQATGDVAINAVVPDVFAPTGAVLCFEDATSVMRGSELCAGIIGDRIVLIDINCRLSSAGPWLREVSARSEVIVIRIGNCPRVIRYNKGEERVDADGTAACLNVLGPQKRKPSTSVDGEEVAIQLLRALTRLEFPAAFWNIQFSQFALDS
jgi:hypothetical protein